MSIAKVTATAPSAQIHFIKTDDPWSANIYGNDFTLIQSRPRCSSSFKPWCILCQRFRTCSLWIQFQSDMTHMSKPCDLPRFPMGSKSRAPSPFKSGCIKSWGFETKLKIVVFCLSTFFHKIPVYLQHWVACIISTIDKILWIGLIQKPIFC